MLFTAYLYICSVSSVSEQKRNIVVVAVFCWVGVILLTCPVLNITKSPDHPRKVSRLNFTVGLDGEGFKGNRSYCWLHSHRELYWGTGW